MMIAGQNVRTATQLYRYLWRLCEKLPGNAQHHYKHHIRQSFNSHSDEADPERVAEIIKKAIEDAEWLLRKYEKR